MRFSRWFIIPLFLPLIPSPSFAQYDTIKISFKDFYCQVRDWGREHDYSSPPGYITWDSTRYLWLSRDLTFNCDSNYRLGDSIFFREQGSNQFLLLLVVDPVTKKINSLQFDSILSGAQTAVGIQLTIKNIITTDSNTQLNAHLMGSNIKLHEPYYYEGYDEIHSGSVFYATTVISADSVLPTSEITITLTKTQGLSVPKNNLNPELYLFPLPALNILNIGNTHSSHPETFIIFDALGRQCLSGKIPEGDQTQDIDIHTLPIGTYTLLLGNTSKRFIVMR